MSLERRSQLAEPGPPELLTTRQCALIDIGRSGFYHQPIRETAEDLALMCILTARFLETPWCGSRQMTRYLQHKGHTIGRKRIRRLMAMMGLLPIYQQPCTKMPNPEHRKFPYLLRDMAINRPNKAGALTSCTPPCDAATSTWSW